MPSFPTTSEFEIGVSKKNDSISEPFDWSPGGPDSQAAFESKRWRDHFRETPSWLTSLVVHLVCFLIFLSLTAPIRFQKGGNSAVVLNVSQHDGDDELNTSVREVKLSQSLQDQGTSSEIPSKIFERTDKLPAATATPEAISAETEAPSPEGDSADEPASSSSSSAAKKYAALTMRLRNRSGGLSHSRSIVFQQHTSQRDTQDLIVDRFILYDIGELRGTQGSLALRNFRALGPDAVPALVRGLNKSANIHASCPVGVIASKLMRILQQAENPALTRYAIDHIGEGVSSYAPHFQRISTLRDRWLRNQEGSNEAISDLLERRGMRGDGAWFEIALSLTSSPFAELMIAIESQDDDLSIPAMIAFLRRVSKLTPSEQVRARRVLERKDTQKLSNDSQVLLRQCLSVLNQKRQAKETQRRRPT